MQHGAGCLDHLLSLPVTAVDGTLAEAAAAFWDAGAADMQALLRPMGVLLDPPGHKDHAAVANYSPTLASHFAGTPWAAGWDRSLMLVEGASRAPKTLWFGKAGAFRAVLLPRAALYSAAERGGGE